MVSMFKHVLWALSNLASCKNLGSNDPLISNQLYQKIVRLALEMVEKTTTDPECAKGYTLL